MGAAPQGYNSLFDTEPAGDRVSQEAERNLLAYDVNNAYMKMRRKGESKNDFPDLYHG